MTPRPQPVQLAHSALSARLSAHSSVQLAHSPQLRSVGSGSTARPVGSAPTARPVGSGSTARPVGSAPTAPSSWLRVHSSVQLPPRPQLRPVGSGRAVRSARFAAPLRLSGRSGPDGAAPAGLAPGPGPPAGARVSGQGSRPVTAPRPVTGSGTVANEAQERRPRKPRRAVRGWVS